ncbi:unnamed protein product [Leptidea sinapis]|uniref:protein-tyrosine-phosphatase n=1 Tax=Leptidea sinapis TaxID=189913 RepID=A0A5E4R5G2_9NEOP|nr:unnamed protein product [Leptidea sinapis]
MIESVSRRAFSSSSGTYNVRASELARERKLNVFNVVVLFLDDTQQTFQIEKKAKGSVLLELVFQNLELVEKDYFGLQFTENGSPPSATNTEITRWLDSSKSVKKQVGGNAQFWLAVRFYPPEPSRLAEEYTRYLLCLQLRKLLLDGRMTAPRNTALLLASFTTCEDERRVRELHKLHKGQSPPDAEANFLEHAKRLPCYGVESHPAKNNIRMNTFSWSKIVKISFKKKQFFIQLKREPSESYDTVLGFNMRSGRAAKALWRCSVERHGFFRLRAPRRRPLLGALGALAGVTAPTVARTETQALEDARRSRSTNRSFVRRSGSRTRERSAGASPALVHTNSARGSRVTTHEEPTPRHAWGDVAHENEDSDGGFLERALRVPLSYVDESESESPEPEPDAVEGAVCVRLAAGPDGRFGFNVRGGGNNTAVLVISINGKDVDELTHEQVVHTIRNTKGVLTLLVKPNGPLASTMGDFWQMVWESESSLIVMLTVLAERGRAKCHQYWPKVGASLKATTCLSVQTSCEQNLGHYVRREMVMKDSNGASRSVTQLQYIAWPDHGVPEDSTAFIDFTKLCSKLRNHRAGMYAM